MADSSSSPDYHNVEVITVCITEIGKAYLDKVRSNFGREFWEQENFILMKMNCKFVSMLVPCRWKSGWSNYYGNNKVLKFFELKEFWIYMVLISHTCSRLKTWCIRVTFVCKFFALENNSCFQDQIFTSSSSFCLLSRQFEISMKSYQCKNGELMRSKSTRLSLRLELFGTLLPISSSKNLAVLQLESWWIHIGMT